MLPSRLWSELTTADLASADMAEVIAVLPVAATEQHGPHLPLGTDTFIMEGYLKAALALMPADLAAAVLPIQTVGCSLEHTGFPGTLSLPARTAIDAWGGLMAQVAAAGCRKIVVVNSHGGNSPVLDILAHEARARLDLLVVLASWQRFGYPDGLFTDDEKRHGIHGGAVETSLMLLFRPDLVRREALRNFVPASVAMEREHAWLRASGRPTGFGWMAEDLHEAGAMGDASAATADAGRAAADHGAAAFVALLKELAGFALPLSSRGSAGAENPGPIVRPE